MTKIAFSPSLKANTLKANTLKANTLKANTLSWLLAPLFLGSALALPAKATLAAQDDTQQSHLASQESFNTAVSERRSAFDNLQSQMELMPLPYEIGDIGPGGGTVFYVDAEGQRGLEAASANQSDNASWDHTPFKKTNASRDGINAGLYNTQRISIANNTAEVGHAADLCESYRGGGLGDWYLPAPVELRHLYDQRETVADLGFGGYWSSAEYYGDNNQAIYFDFSRAEERVNLKNFRRNVRCIRAF